MGRLRVPTVLPSRLRRLPWMLTLRLSMTKLPRTSLRPESREILMLLPLPTTPELHGRRISSREDRTRTDSSTSTRIPPPRPPRSKASTTRERELTADSSRPSPLSEHVIDFNAKINKVKILYLFKKLSYIDQ